VANELILTFHGLGEPPAHVSASERRVWTPVKWLHAVLDALPAAGVRVTFDDANVSDVEQALPALAERGRTAEFFVLAGELGAPGRLTRADVRRLHGAGMAIGSHGLHHCDWRRASDTELVRELAGSREALSTIIDSDVAEAACPYGSYDRRVLRALRAAGYRRAYTSDGPPSASTQWLWSRTTVTRDRPLADWLALVAAGPARRRAPAAMAKSYLKRIR
jgi:peptidoglycan/xylan/chitin deacetylase (PgdA/CDA1 family)